MFSVVSTCDVEFCNENNEEIVTRCKPFHKPETAAELSNSIDKDVIGLALFSDADSFISVRLFHHRATDRHAFERTGRQRRLITPS